MSSLAAIWKVQSLYLYMYCVQSWQFRYFGEYCEHLLAITEPRDVDWLRPACSYKLSAHIHPHSVGACRLEDETLWYG